jgi:hypothetical protein
MLTASPAMTVLNLLIFGFPNTRRFAFGSSGEAYAF